MMKMTVLLVCLGVWCRLNKRNDLKRFTYFVSYDINVFKENKSMSICLRG